MLAVRSWPLLFRPALLAVVLTSCYQPDLGPGKFQCKADDPCPDGQVCRGGYCRLPEEDNADGGGGGKDGGGGSADMAQPSKGCSRDGAKVADKVYACRGNFGEGGYKSLCGAGHHACSVAADGKLLEGVRGCSEGFFVVEQGASGRWDDGLRVTCPPQTGNDHFSILVGCGGDEFGVIDRDVKVDACPAIASMPALRYAVRCGSSIEPWKCKTGLADTRHDSLVYRGGTLCCQD